MRILVLNIGSSSLKFSVFEMPSGAQVFKAAVERFSHGLATLSVWPCGETGVHGECKRETHEITVDSVEDALTQLPSLLLQYGSNHVQAVAHRIAHGGDMFTRPTLLTDDVVRQLDDLTPLAPLHNPLMLKGVRIARAAWPTVPHVAVFDTAFHQTMPPKAYSYAVPEAWREVGLRRYGFHGSSHKYVVQRVAQALDKPLSALRIISCHLGNGASVCAVEHGFSVDTSMGLTPLEGLVMGSRSGDVDPGLFTFLQRTLGLSVEQVEKALYEESGLKGLSGIGNDLRDIEREAALGNQRAQLAIDVYAYRARKYIGAYAAAMGGVDVVVFTGGIGENSPSMRRRICDRLQFLGVMLNEERNLSARVHGYDVLPLHDDAGRVHVLMTQTHEQGMIAQEAYVAVARKAAGGAQNLLKARGLFAYPAASFSPSSGEIVAHQEEIGSSIVQAATSGGIPVAVSARHVHLTESAVAALFGKGYVLTPDRALSQPNQWAARETVDVVGPKGELRHVRVLLPLRHAVQIEVSRTDTFVLGIDAPVRPSGHTEHTPFVLLRGPEGTLRTDGLIVAARHIHMSTADAVALGLADGDYVDVRVSADGAVDAVSSDSEKTGARGSVVFGNTLIRVADDWLTEMHIDTDEANAAGISVHTEGIGELVCVPSGRVAGLCG